MALRWREPIRLRRALAKRGFDTLSPVPRLGYAAAVLAAGVLLLGVAGAVAGAAGVTLTGLAMGMLATTLLPWADWVTHRSVLITADGIAVFASRAETWSLLGEDIRRYSIESIRRVSIEEIDGRGTARFAIVCDLDDGTPVAVGIPGDRPPSELRQRLEEWGYPTAP